MTQQEEKPIAEVQQTSGALWHKQIRTTEGRVLGLGVVVLFTGLVLMGVEAFSSPQTAHMLGVMSLSNIVFGRAVSMSIGYAGGYGHVLVVPVNMWVETVLVLLFYPLFVFSMRKLVVFPSLKRLLERTNAAAERHQDKVRRYGIIGLFMFVWFPFWMTGPVVGAAIGYLLSLPAWLTLLVVLTGTYIAMLVWAWALFGLYSHAAVFGPWAPAGIVGGFVLIALLGYGLHRHRKADGK